jgi:pyrroline-5-carboxylate reductase
VRIGILGAGHLGGYLLEGFSKRGPGAPVLVADCRPGQAQAQAERWGARAAADNQALVDGSDLVILAVRPGDAVPACQALAFRPDQVLASAAAGVKLADLAPAAAPARAVRIMPISSAALNISPTLVFPGQPRVREAFALLGQVHVLPDEAAFTAASAIAAFYAWMYALAGEAVAWTVGAGVPPEVARALVLETIRSAAEMGLAHPEQGLSTMLDRLATPGGISELGLGVMAKEDALGAWSRALDAVLARMGGRT